MPTLIVQVANFYGPCSGGLRTAVDQLGREHTERGHTVWVVVPGSRAREEELPSGVYRITVPALRVPFTGGYRVADPGRVIDVLRGRRPVVPARQPISRTNGLPPDATLWCAPQSSRVASSIGSVRRMSIGCPSASTSTCFTRVDATPSRRGHGADRRST